MNLGSLILGILSLILMVAGAIFSIVPYVGAVVSFLGPVAGLAGIVLGGVAMSRAKRDTGETDGLAIAGLIVSAIGFILSLLVAMTCGLCNACASAGMQQNGGRVQWNDDTLSPPLPTRPDTNDQSGRRLDDMLELPSPDQPPSMTADPVAGPELAPSDDGKAE